MPGGGVAELVKHWAGRVAGTNTGNVSVKLERDAERENGIEGTLRLADDQYGVVTYVLAGTFDGSVLEAAGAPDQVPPEVNAGELTIQGILTPEGQITGEWKSTLGTGGVFRLFPHDIAATGPRMGGLTEQVNEEHRVLGSIRLFGDEIQAVATDVVADFSATPRPLVTYRNDAGTKTTYLDDFLEAVENLGEISYLKIFAQEPEAYGINRVVVLELGNHVQNSIRVQGVQHSWVVGKAEALSRRLAQYEEPLSTGYKKWGVGLVQLLLLATLLVSLPSLDSTVYRIVLLFVVAALLWAFNKVHAVFLPNLVVSARKRPPIRWMRAIPRLLSWFAAILAAVLAAYAAYLLGIS